MSGCPNKPDCVDRGVSEFDSVVCIGMMPQAACAFVLDGQAVESQPPMLAMSSVKTIVFYVIRERHDMIVASEPHQSLSKAQAIAASVNAARSNVMYCHCREDEQCHQGPTQAKSKTSRRTAATAEVPQSLQWDRRQRQDGLKMKHLLAGRRSTKLLPFPLAPKPTKAEIWVHDSCLEFWQPRRLVLAASKRQALIAARDFCVALKYAIEAFKTSLRPSCLCGARD